MKPSIVVLTGGLVFLVGCQAPEPPPEPAYDNSQINRWLSKSIKDSAINNAIITQSTLYPYHFVKGSDELNGLGSRDLGVLAEHFRDVPGELRLRKGDIVDELYDARVEVVRERLVEAGVDSERIEITDGLAGGEGLSSEEVIFKLQRSRESVTFSSQREMGQTRIINQGGSRGGGSGR